MRAATSTAAFGSESTPSGRVTDAGAAGGAAMCAVWVMAWVLFEGDCLDGSV
jgi:hypothetical protein